MLVFKGICKIKGMDRDQVLPFFKIIFVSYLLIFVIVIKLSYDNKNNNKNNKKEAKSLFLHYQLKKAQKATKYTEIAKENANVRFETSNIYNLTK